jgi:putative NADH-flavin reductase
MKLLILGATGATGQHLVELALAEGHDVTAIVRDPSKVTTKHERLHVVKGLATVPAELEPALAGKDAVLSAIGPRSSKDPVCADAAAAVVAAMKKQGVARVVWLSASGVGDSRDTAVDASFVFGRIIMPLFLKHPYANHAKAEETLRASGLKWTVLRPLQLVDKPTGSPATATLPGVKPGALKIARRDVAAFMLKELASGGHIGQMPLLWT